MADRVIVTGAAGFIGSHVCEALLAQNWKVTGLDNFDPFYDEAVKRRNLAKLEPHEQFEFTQGDIRSLDQVRALMQEPAHALIHLAARAGVRPSIEDPLGYQDVNVHGTAVILEAIKEQPNCRLIFGSSSSVYGNNARVPFCESDPLENMQSPYAATKRCGELLCQTYHHLYGLNVTCLRFFTVYGPRQRPDLAIHKFVRLMESGNAIPMFGDGTMRRDFTYVDDIVTGVIRAMNRCQGFDVINLGNSSPVSVLELIKHIEQATGRTAEIQRLPQPPGDVNQTYADLAHAKETLDFQPTTDLHAGLERFVTWFRSEHLA